MSRYTDESQAHGRTLAGLNRVREAVASILGGWKNCLREVCRLFFEKEKPWVSLHQHVLMQAKVGWDTGTRCVSGVIAYLLQTRIAIAILMGTPFASHVTAPKHQVNSSSALQGAVRIPPCRATAIRTALLSSGQTFADINVAERKASFEFDRKSQAKLAEEEQLRKHIRELEKSIQTAEYKNNVLEKWLQERNGCLKALHRSGSVFDKAVLDMLNDKDDQIQALNDELEAQRIDNQTPDSSELIPDQDNASMQPAITNEAQNYRHLPTPHEHDEGADVGGGPEVKVMSSQSQPYSSALNESFNSKTRCSISDLDVFTTPQKRVTATQVTPLTDLDGSPYSMGLYISPSSTPTDSTPATDTSRDVAIGFCDTSIPKTFGSLSREPRVDKPTGTQANRPSEQTLDTPTKTRTQKRNAQRRRARQRRQQRDGYGEIEQGK